ncbi:MAG: hypothetical protein ACOZBZ_01345 [Patescibacteria group bacterium]
MLTKADLSQIRKIVREEIETESKSLQEELQGEIKLSRMEIQKDVHLLANKVKNLEMIANKIQKSIKSVVNFFDREYLRLRKQVERLEEHLNLPSLQ